MEYMEVNRVRHFNGRFGLRMLDELKRRFEKTLGVFACYYCLARISDVNNEGKGKFVP